ncbi:pentatricopeptide repeat-containing protein [Canna indica]|uniref:Pentatricopeptide repeat-containing protein n=1 Tax=Canna indica TaxID=4628 RepID=A0AAQ3QC10_9LILI|nr:pentatricopeptide repeat-containing protein [Canna indica]
MEGVIHRLSKSCVSISYLKQLLAQIIVAGAASHRSSLSRLLSFAATCQDCDLGFASLLLTHAPIPAVFAYNSTLQALVAARLPGRALLLYLRMTRECVAPDRFTFPSVLKACAILSATATGEAVHARILHLGFCSDPYVQSGMIRIYSDFGDASAARRVFDEILEGDVVLWNSMIGGYIKCGHLTSARQLFDEMGRRNVGTYNALLGGYAKLGYLESASQLFDKMPDRDVVSWNTMIGAHARSGAVKATRDLLARAPQKNAASWSSAISGLAQSCRFTDALDLFKDMLQIEGPTPNQSALVSVLSSCAHLGALEQGEWIHEHIRRKEIEVDDLLGSSLIDMYAKCGVLRGAVMVFDGLPKRDVCAWTSMIYAFAMHGRSQEALETFREMERAGIRPSDATIVAVLCACSHAGFVEQGRDIFLRSRQDYGIAPKIEHYTCMVDIFSRGNLIEEALELIKSMPMEADEFVWGALLGGLRANGRDKMLDDALLSKMINLKPRSSGAYVLAANIFASTDRWDDVTRMRRTMEGLGAKKNPGCSMIEVDGIVHKFLASGRINMKSEQLYDMLHQVNRAMKVDCLT